MSYYKKWPRQKQKSQLRPKIASDRPDHIVLVVFPQESMTVQTAITSLESLLFQLDAKDKNRGIQSISFDKNSRTLKLLLDV